MNMAAIETCSRPERVSRIIHGLLPWADMTRDSILHRLDEEDHWPGGR